MFLASCTTGAWQTNCYIAGARGSRQCVVIDPGMDAAETVRSTVSRHHLVPVAVLATHGHIDHVADAAVLADDWGVPVWIHSADRPMLTDPLWGLAPQLAGTAGLVPARLDEPADVREYDGLSELELAGLTFRLVHAPGHTPGGMLLAVSLSDEPDLDEAWFTGDTLFAGSIGRTDFAVSDPAAMKRTLAGPIASIPDAAAVLPGHGAQTLMAHERATNPYLQPRFLGV